MNEHEESLPEELRARLRDEFGSDTPRNELRDGTVARLREAGLVGRPLAPSAWRRLGALAAGVLLFTAGLWLGGNTSRAPSAAEGDLFLMLLREPAEGLRVDGTSEADLVAEYGAWARGLAVEGRLVRGEKLGEQIARLGSDLAGAGLEERHVSGFFLLRAESLEAAVELARSCPHVRYGGEAEVRPIEPT